MLKRAVVGLGFVASVLCFATSNAAANQAAIVYDVQGATKPDVASFDELSDGSLIELSKDTVLNFVHYKLCKNITVKGGSIKIEGDKFTVNNGSILSQTDEDCPDRVLLKNESTVIGSIKLRSVPSKTAEIGRSPAFLTTDKGWPVGSKVSLLTIDQELIANLNLRGRTASLPSGSSLLEPEKKYILVIETKGKKLTKSFVCKNVKNSITVVGNNF
jgi:hypothetical protein